MKKENVYSKWKQKMVTVKSWMWLQGKSNMPLCSLYEWISESLIWTWWMITKFMRHGEVSIWFISGCKSKGCCGFFCFLELFLGNREGVHFKVYYCCFWEGMIYVSCFLVVLGWLRWKWKVGEREWVWTSMDKNKWL